MDKGLQKHPNPEAWLFETAKNIVMKSNIKQQKEATVELVENIADETSIHDIFDYKILFEKYTNFLSDKLSKRERLFYALKYVEGLNLSQISQRLNMPLGTAKYINAKLRDKIINKITEL